MHFENRAIFGFCLELTRGAISVSGTVLVFARDSASASSATSGLQGYGIPYEVVIVPQSGITLPTLSSSASEGNYGSIIVMSEVAYSFVTGWSSAITPAQWQTLYDYQTSFGVRMVRLDSFPSTDLGVTAASGGGCCNTGVEQLVSITDTSSFPTANLKTGADVSTEGLWHYPAVITNSTIAHSIASFAPDSSGTLTGITTAAIINNFNGRQQMVWFLGWATDWSQTSNYLQHAHIHWMTRGLFLGRRKTYLNTQVDDMHLQTALYLPQNQNFRIRPSDLDAHKAWQSALNARLPPGSTYFIEVGHNGNGDIEQATSDAAAAAAVCTPPYGVEYDSPPDTPLEFAKPLGTGTDLWPPEFANYTWSGTCAARDPVAAWFAGEVGTFAAVSHTFTHEELNNATYHDASREIYFNQAWLAQVGLGSGERFSGRGLIPPAITGLHNGDAIRAWMDNGIRFVVGDNTRPVLRNQESSFWPLITTTEGNGYSGLVIIPRWATTIYYNCCFQNCTTLEWINTSGGSGTFTDLLDNARSVNTRYLLGLHHDPYMFHQANLRHGDVDPITIGSESGPLSLFQIWVETITQEMTRLTNWPILSLKHDDIATIFLNRMELDKCSPALRYHLSDDGQFIVRATVSSANGNTCGVPVPVTMPGSATAAGSAALTREQVGSEPVVYWVGLNGGVVDLVLGEGVGV
ncbi:hypothetical protein B0T18DRAFT_478288 [Schizothecium vesticola]|uniref:Extracellular serine-rich protein n=1 Tax=Schizothecium vesticola TaxID=314040 RepID=A0AA40K9V8_9PEZI|nr:hypothetical protein B0T18DRAFT_478288 [Schizothecium vesticola]